MRLRSCGDVSIVEPDYSESYPPKPEPAEITDSKTGKVWNEKLGVWEERPRMVLTPEEARHRTHSFETVDGIPYEELIQMEAARELVHVLLNPHSGETKQPAALECGCCSDCGCFCDVVKFETAEQKQ